METRIIEQVKIYKLLLNPMTANFEAHNMVAIAYDRDDLQSWYESLKVEPYQDGRFHKTFRKDSALELYNPIEWSDYCRVEEEWTTQENIDGFIEHAKSSYGMTTVPVLVDSAMSGV